MCSETWQIVGNTILATFGTIGVLYLCFVGFREYLEYKIYEKLAARLGRWDSGDFDILRDRLEKVESIFQQKEK